MQLAPIKSLKNEDFLRQKYLDEGLSLQEIAAETVSSWKTVRRHLLCMKIPLRTKDRLINEQVKFGFQRIEGQLLKHESEQAALDIIRMLRGQGFSIRQIVEELNRLRIPCRKVGAQWHIKTVYNILSRVDFHL